jgi:D-beta-D-heptose 7-phosphate kinase/D-beta-D-heptose 1-phosphate adenosyltransferase
MIDFLEFRHKRVLVVGDAILDEYLSGDCLRLSPEAPVPVLRVSDARTVLGGAANTAANVAALGAQVSLLTLVGPDAAGNQLGDLCRHAGIELEPVRDGRGTLRKTRVVGQRQQLVRLDYEQTQPVDASIERAALDLIQARMTEFDIVVISDYAKGLVTERICQGAIAAAHALDKQVVIDPRPQHRTFYRGCDYLTPNWKESQALLGQVELAPSLENVDRTGRALARELECNVLLTLGPNGMAFFGRDDAEHFAVPTMAREVFDVSGAGDTVVATFALACACGASHAEAVGLANQAAGIVVGKFGTATVAVEDLAAPEDRRRLLSRRELEPLVAVLRQQGKRIVTTNGAFDVLHAGHLYFLREARRLGDVLLVGLNADASIRQYKGPKRPVIPQEERADMLLALRYVDYVHIFDEPVPMPFLQVVRPDVHVNGAEYGEECIEADVVHRDGGRIHIVDRRPGLATSSIISRLRELDEASVLT